MNSARGGSKGIFRRIYHARLSLEDLNTVKPANHVIGLPELGELGVAALIGHDILCQCRVASDGIKWTLSPL